MSAVRTVTIVSLFLAMSGLSDSTAHAAGAMRHLRSGLGNPVYQSTSGIEINVRVTAQTNPQVINGTQVYTYYFELNVANRSGENREVVIHSVKIGAQEADCDMDIFVQGRRFMNPGDWEDFLPGNNRPFNPGIYCTSPTGAWTPATYEVALSFYEESQQNTAMFNNPQFGSGGIGGGGAYPPSGSGQTPVSGGTVQTGGGLNPPPPYGMVPAPGGAGSPGNTGGLGSRVPSDADMVRLQDIQQRLMNMSTRMQQSGYGGGYSDAQFCTDMTELVCIYRDLELLDWDPSVQASFSQLIPMYDNMMAQTCGGPAACGGTSGRQQGRRVDFVDPYANFTINAPPAMVVNPNPSPPPSGATLGPGNLQGGNLNTNTQRCDPASCEAIERRRENMAPLPPPPPPR